VNVAPCLPPRLVGAHLAAVALDQMADYGEPEAATAAPRRDSLTEEAVEQEGRALRGDALPGVP
jgi:hypothetical protein